MTGARRHNPATYGLLLLGLLLLVFGVSSFARRIGATEPAVGVEWVQSSSGPLALVVTEGGSAWRAGIRPGDRLLRVDGRRVDSAFEASELGWDDRGAIRLELQRGAAPLRVELYPERRLRTEPYGYLAVVGLAFWLSAMFITLRMPTVRAGQIYALLALCLFAQLTLSHTGRADAFDWSVYWADLAAGALAPALLLHLGVALTRRTLRRPRRLVAIAYATSAGLFGSAVWLNPGALGGAYRFGDPLAALQFRDRAEPLFLATALLLSVALLAKSHERSASGLQRSQQRWLIWGLTTGLGPFVLLYAVPWALGVPELPTWAQFVVVVPLLFVPAVFTAALVRYRLHDLDLIVLRGFSEVTAVFGTFGVYATAGFLLRDVLGDVLPLSRSAIRYVGLLAAALSYPQVRRLVKGAVDRAFYRKRYSYRATLLDWARELNTETDLLSLLGGLRDRIRETLGVPEAAVLLRTGPWSFDSVGNGPASRLELDAASLEQLGERAFIGIADGSLELLPWASYLFAMNVKGRLRAVLAVAERTAPEEPLNTEDRALLGTLAAHAASAIETARLVAEVRQRADEIERLHARQEKILESSAVGLLLLDADGRIEAWNRALEDIYGLPRSEAIGCALGEILPLHVARRIQREGRVDGASAESRTFRLGLVNRNGKRIVVNMAISRVGADGDADGSTVVTLDDVSERVELEEQVLQQERLASLGLLAAGVAHEINTPLTGISSYTQMLLEENTVSESERSILEKIEAQTHRATRITGSLLNLANPERTAFEALDVNDTIQEVLQLFEPQIRRRGIRLQIELAAGLPVVRGHRGKLQQLLLNLLINARDAIVGEGKIEVRTEARGDRVVVEVADDGRGIAEEDLPRIFDPFFSTKGRGKGNGLGLSISYGIARDHAGEIRVDSRPGSSTRFMVELPSAPSAGVLATGRAGN